MMKDADKIKLIMIVVLILAILEHSLFRFFIFLTDNFEIFENSLFSVFSIIIIHILVFSGFFSLRYISKKKLQLERHFSLFLKNPVLLILIFALIIRIYSLSKVYGFLINESSENLSIAYGIVHGFRYGWEGRSWFYPMILSLPIYALKLMRVTSINKIILIMRIFPIFFSITSIYLIYLIGKKIENEFLGLVTALFLSVNWLFTRWSVSFVGGIPATTLILISFYLFLKNKTNKSLFLSGLFLGFGFMCRYQSIIFLVPLVFWLVYNNKIKGLYPILAGFSLTVLLQGMMDFFVYRSSPIPFLHSIIAFIEYVFIDNLSAVYHGTRPIGWYLSTMVDWFSVELVVLFLFGLFFNTRRKKFFLILLTTIITFLIMSIVSHKELRYLLSILPFFCLLSACTLRTFDELIKLSKISFIKLFSNYLLILIFFSIVISNVIHVLGMDLNPNAGYMDGIKYLIENGEKTVAMPHWTVGGFYTGGKDRWITLFHTDIDRNYLKDPEYADDILNNTSNILLENEYIIENGLSKIFTDNNFRLAGFFSDDVVLYSKNLKKDDFISFLKRLSKTKELLKIEVDLGATQTSDGLIQRSVIDGYPENVEVSGKECKKILSQKGVNEYMYFFVDDEFIHGGKNEVYIIIEYYDDGIDRFTVEYDAFGDRPGLNHKKACEIIKTNSKEWKEEICYMNDAEFINSMHRGADFRIWSNHDGEDYINKVSVMKGSLTSRLTTSYD